MLRTKTLEQKMNTFGGLDLKSGSRYMVPTIDLIQPLYFEARRNREGRIKKFFGVLNGVGWAATFVGGLTLTGIGTLGLGVPAIVTVSVATLPPGTLFGYFQANDDVTAENQKEKELVAATTKQLNQIQKNQIELVAAILKAENRLISGLKSLALELNMTVVSGEPAEQRDLLFSEILTRKIPKELEKKFRHLVLLAHSIHQTVNVLCPVSVLQTVTVLCPISVQQTMQDPVETFKITSADLKEDLQRLKDDQEPYENFCQASACQKILHTYVDVKAAKKLIVADVTPTDQLDSPTSAGFFAAIKKVGKQIFATGNSVGIGFGIGTIFCGVALASNPPGWVILATIAGIALTSIVLGAAAYYVDNSIKARQLDNIQYLQELKNEVTEYGKQQLQLGTNLKDRLQKLKVCNEVTAVQTLERRWGKEATPVPYAETPALFANSNVPPRELVSPIPPDPSRMAAPGT